MSAMDHFRLLLLSTEEVIPVNILQKMNEALDYIEQNLTDDIDYVEVSRISLCSEYHFSRMFSFLAGITLSEYIRNRRLSLAAIELSQKNSKIIDIVIKYGYNSPDSFTRAFQKSHGSTPSEARSANLRLKVKNFLIHLTEMQN